MNIKYMLYLYAEYIRFLRTVCVMEHFEFIIINAASSTCTDIRIVFGEGTFVIFIFL